jgi:phenylalanyl-tRNA synthetase beta chain
MTGIGFSEAVTFGFVPERAAIPFAPAPDALVHIRNPLSEAFAVLRPSLLPGLVEAAAVNVRRGRADVRLFEAGSRFQTDRGERRAIAYVWAGAGRPLHWSERPRPVDFFDAKGAACSLALAHDVDVEVEAMTAAPPHLARGQAALLFPRPGRNPDTPPLGVVGQLAGDVAESFGLPGNVPVFVAELDVEELARHATPMIGVAPIPRVPAVVRDISIQVDARVTAASVRATITAAAGPLLEELREFDRYQGKGIPEGQLSLSLRLTFRAADRTLTDEEVQASMDAVLAALREEHSAVQR